MLQVRDSGIDFTVWSYAMSCFVIVYLCILPGDFSPFYCFNPALLISQNNFHISLNKEKTEIIHSTSQRKKITAFYFSKHIQCYWSQKISKLTSDFSLQETSIWKMTHKIIILLPKNICQGVSQQIICLFSTGCTLMWSVCVNLPLKITAVPLNIYLWFGNILQVYSRQIDSLCWPFL